MPPRSRPASRAEGTVRRKQGLFWLLTVPYAAFTPYLPPGLDWIKGQLETGAGGFLHWQVCCAFSAKTSLRGVKLVFGDVHAELTYSGAAGDYVWKEDTRVAGTQFELGVKPCARKEKRDWDRIWSLAVAGDFLSIPTGARIQCYNSIRRIYGDFAVPVAVQRECFIYWGESGSGKSHDAWAMAGVGAYCKDPQTKFWCGYQNHLSVVIDEFQGNINISHLLRWADCHPVFVETKGGNRPLMMTKLFITSNVDPRLWYPDINDEQRVALLRRFKITRFVRPLRGWGNEESLSTILTDVDPVRQH